MDALLPI